MLKKMRRQEKQLSKEDIEVILKETEYGTLATVGENEYPYTTPMNYAYHQENIYLHGALKGHKIDNIKYNNKVSFSIVGKTNLLPGKFTSEYESVVLFGTAELAIGEDKIVGLKALVQKYSSNYVKEGMEYISRASIKTAVIKISIDHITGKVNGK